MGPRPKSDLRRRVHMMRTTLPTHRPPSFDAADNRGFALPAALAVLVLLSVLVVTVYANAMASFRSGMTDLGVQRDILRLGAERWINKPFEIKDFIRILRERIGPP